MTALLSQQAHHSTELRRRFPDLLGALYILADYHAVEARCAAAAMAAANAAEPDESEAQQSIPRRLQVAIDEARIALVRRRETEVLLPAAGRDNATALVILLPAAEGPSPRMGEIDSSLRGGGRRQLRCVSCVVSSLGELLYLDHTPEALAADRPVSLGRLVPGASSCRALREKEIHSAFYPWLERGTTVPRRLFGVEIRLFPTAPVSAVTSLTAVPMGGDGTDIVLLATSLDDFNLLRATFREWLADNEPASCSGVGIMRDGNGPGTALKIGKRLRNNTMVLLESLAAGVGLTVAAATGQADSDSDSELDAACGRRSSISSTAGANPLSSPPGFRHAAETSQDPEESIVPETMQKSVRGPLASQVPVVSTSTAVGDSDSNEGAYVSRTSVSSTVWRRTLEAALCEATDLRRAVEQVEHRLRAGLSEIDQVNVEGWT